MVKSEKKEQKMKAAVYRNDILEIKELRKPVLRKKGAIVKVLGCGLCGSDIIKIKHSSVEEGTVLGHEVVGRIVQINSNSDFMEGEKVVMGHHVPCFSCTYCYGENYSMCRKFKKTNLVPGGFAEYIYVSEDHLLNTVFRVPEYVDNERISYTEPLACCIRAVKRTNIPYNSNVLIVGLGSIGNLMGQAARQLGYVPYGIDLLPERVEFAKKVGFENAFTLFDNVDELIDEMKLEVNPNGFDGVILTAGSDSGIPLAIDAVRDGGTITVFSSVPSDMSAYMNNQIYYRELTVTGSYSSSPVDLEEAFNMLLENSVKTDGMAVKYPLENINDAVQDTITNQIMKAYIEL